MTTHGLPPLHDEVDQHQGVTFAVRALQDGIPGGTSPAAKHSVALSVACDEVTPWVLPVCCAVKCPE